MEGLSQQMSKCFFPKKKQGCLTFKTLATIFKKSARYIESCRIFGIRVSTQAKDNIRIC